MVALVRAKNTVLKSLKVVAELSGRELFQILPIVQTCARS